MKGMHIAVTVALIVGVLFLYHTLVQNRGSLSMVKQGLGIG